MKVLSQRQSVWNRECEAHSKIRGRSETYGGRDSDRTCDPTMSRESNVNKTGQNARKDALNDRIPPLINKENFVFALELLWNRVPHRDEVGIE